MELGGRVALVTGGAGGIGGAVARSLARSGISGVGINYRKSAEGAEQLAAEIERSGVKAIAVRADIQSDDQVRAMIGKIQNEFGRLDVLVNNAGLELMTPIVDGSDPVTDAFRRIVEINVIGTALVTAAAGALVCGASAARGCACSRPACRPGPGPSSTRAGTAARGVEGGFAPGNPAGRVVGF